MGDHATRPAPVYSSDRWITPPVVIAAIATVGLCFLGIVAAATYLIADGHDAAPLLRVFSPAAIAAAATSALGGLGVLALKTQLGKVQRDTGTLAAALTPPAPRTDFDDVLDGVPVPRRPR